MTPSAPRPSRAQRRRRRRRAAATRWAVRIAAGAVLLALGVALGQALHDNPQPGSRETVVRTLRPLPLAPATLTVTARR